MGYKLHYEISTQEKFCSVCLQMVLDQQKILSQHLKISSPSVTLQYLCIVPGFSCVIFALGSAWDCEMGGGLVHMLGPSAVCSRPDSSQPELLLLPVRGNVPSSAQPAERRRSRFLRVVRKRRIWDIIKLLVWWEAKSIKVWTN